MIAAHRTATVSLSDLRDAAYAADLSLSGNPDARLRLLESLQELKDAGLVLFPAGKDGWDDSIQPRLPRWVRRQASTKKPAASVNTAPTRAWHARFAWAARFVADERPSPAEFTLLTAAHNYAVNGRDRRIVPIAERSLELLDDEKALDVLSRRRLFLPGRLTLADLRCERLPMPLATWSVGTGSTTLLVENHTTAHTLGNWLSRDGAVGTVVFSAGSQLPQVLASLPDAHDRSLAYFGDLDLRGVEIAADGHQRSLELGLGPLVPAVGLYRLLLEVGKVRPATSRRRTPSGPHVFGWLPENSRADAREIIDSGARVAQEGVSADFLETIDGAAFDPLR